MLFGRRKRPHPWKRISNAVWPRAGWRRTAVYFRHRVSRIADTPHSIAAGLAAGAAISFTPFMGLHFVLAAVLAWITNGNLFASAVGTAVGNPWTFPVIWLLTLEIGRFIIGGTGSGLGKGELTMRMLVEHPFEIFLPMSVGGILVAVVVWFTTYYVSKPLVAAYQHRRRERIRGGRQGESDGE